jgi:Short C-terminal domain
VTPVAQRTTFAKLQRERARKARKHEKLARRQNNETPETAGSAESTSDDEPVVRVRDRRGPIGPDELLRLTQQLTAAYESGELSEEEFEEQKKELMSRL